MTLTPSTKRRRAAFLFASEIHEGQKRTDKRVPYIQHPIRTALLVEQDGGSEDEIAAAFLHDTLEDHPDKTSPDELRERFGMAVAEIVLSLTDSLDYYNGTERPAWRPRKEAYLERIRSGGLSPGALRVSIADKLDNLTELLEDYKRDGIDTFERFTGKRAGLLWYYPALLGAFRRAGASGPLFDKYTALVKEMVEIA